MRYGSEGVVTEGSILNMDMERGWVGLLLIFIGFAA
jgi:hypothetical protein